MNKNFKKTVGISLAMAVMLSTSGLAVAATTKENVKPIHQSTQVRSAKVELTDEEKATILAKQKEKLDAKVTEGTLTQTEADELYAAAVNGDYSKAFRTRQKGNKTELTDEQKATHLAKYKENLDAKVTEGKITQTEADELYTAAVNGDYSKAFGLDKRGRGPKGIDSNATKETTTE